MSDYTADDIAEALAASLAALRGLGLDPYGFALDAKFQGAGLEIARRISLGESAETAIAETSSLFNFDTPATTDQKSETA